MSVSSLDRETYERRVKKMDLFYWIVIGALAGFLAKMQFPTERDQNVLVLLSIGVVGAVLGGFAVQMALHSAGAGANILGLATAFMAAVALLFIQRMITNPRTPKPRPRTR